MVHVPPSGRMAFLAELRALSVQRFDAAHSPITTSTGASSARPLPILQQPAQRLINLQRPCGTPGVIHPDDRQVA
jgi:hypothetical protein